MSLYDDMRSEALRFPPKATAVATRFAVPRPANLDRPFRALPAPAPAPQAVTGDAGWYVHFGKRALDLVLVILTLPVTLPVIALCALALWIESGLPFYWQDRIGLGGRRFRIVKLRTMVRDADAQLVRYLATDPAIRDEWNRTQKLRNDPRITPVGNILRATSLDELPQLWNVIKGEMSLVGPRPMLPEQAGLYGDDSCYASVRPGITGLWQVSARNDKEFSHRAKVDVVYCRSLSLWRDIVLMVRTIGVVLRRTGI